MSIAIGIDIGGTNTKLGIVTRDGQLLQKLRFSTGDYPVQEDFLHALRRHVEILLSSIDSSGRELTGIGIGAPKANYFTGMVQGAANLRWEGPVDLRGFLQSAFEVPVFVTNDANLAALGEKEFGGARGMAHFLSVTIGTGLGCGIYVSGQLVHGKSDMAGELGHTSVKPGGRYCQCGKKGCLEAYVSARGMVRTTLKLLSKYEDDSELRSVSSARLTPQIIGDAAMRGDKLAALVMDFTGDILGFKLADMVALFNPEAIFLAGGIANAGPLLFNSTLLGIKKYLFNTYTDPVQLLPSELKDDEMAVMGGGALVWEHLENQWQLVN